MGCLCQMGANVIYGLAGNELYVVPQSLLFAVVAAVLQCLLALARPGSLGFGDVTCTLMIGLCVGAFGLTAMLGWWVLMGIIGLVWMTLWLRFDPQSQSSHAGKVPFAPVIVSAGLIAAAMALMM